MKKIFLPLIILALFSCEEIVYKDVIKYVDRPVPVTTFVQTSKTEECVSTDTTKVEIIMPDVLANGQQAKDTTLAVTTACHMKITIKGKVQMEPLIITEDSIVYRDTTIYITNTVNVPGPTVTLYRDTTIYETKVVYTTNTIYLFPGSSAFYIPEPYKIHYDSFIEEGLKRNAPMTGGEVILTLVKPNELSGEGWVSESWEIQGFQWIIRLSDELTVEQSRSAIFRELARMQLNKKYSQDINKIMSPYFDPSRTVSKLQIDELFQ